MVSLLYSGRKHKYNSDMNPQNPYQPNQGQTPPQMSPAQPTQPFQSPAPGYGPAAQMSQNFVHVEPPKTWKIIGIVGIATSVLALGGLVWALINYFDQKDNVDTIVSSAVATAVKEQADKDAAAYQEKEKEPNRQFAGPEDYGSVSFDYPKTWSVYVNKDASSGGVYEAYLNPGAIPPVSNSQQFAVRVTIADTDYDRAIASYENLVEKGDLNSKSVKVNGDFNATRFDGNFTKDIRGSAVLFKIRDKTVTIRTDADTFKSDFDKLIGTITFNS